MRYFATFADDGSRIATYVADGMPLTVSDIIEQYPNAIEITAEDQAKYVAGYVRGRNGTPIMPVNRLEDVKQMKIDEIQAIAREKLLVTDHDIVEYFELRNLTEFEYKMLKQKRQAIRDYRDGLISNIKQMNDEPSVLNVQFLM